MTKINRRQFLALSAAGAGTAIVAGCTQRQAGKTQAASSSALNLTPLHQSQNGLLELDLEARKGSVVLGGKQASLLTYNGQIPAPRLETKPGDKNGRPMGSGHMSLMAGREGDIITVNGNVNPSLSLPENGLLRLRILNASPSRFYRLALDNHPFYQIATDGLGLNEPVETKELLLTPGQRADVLIKGDKQSGQYSLLNLPYNRGSMGMIGGGMMGSSDKPNGILKDTASHMASLRDTPITLATLNYESAAESLALPTKLTSVSALPEPERVKRFELNHGMSPRVGMAFLINGKPYEGDRLDTEVKLNTTEDWELINTGVMDHPFHIHGSAFQVISRNGQPESLLAWRDTVLVKRGETVRIRIRFRDFAGKTVYHCHILDHEDLGMMGNLMIRA